MPSEGYLSKAKALCEKYNVLFIADEVQTGIAPAPKSLPSLVPMMTLADD